MATYKTNKPDGQDPIRVSDDYIRNNFRLLEQGLSGTHVFSGAAVAPGIPATRGMHRPGLVPICAVELEATLTGYTDRAGAICWPTDLDGFWTNDGTNWTSRSIAPSGTVAIWAQSTAPAGWTLVTTCDDGVVIVSSAGGGAAIAGGTWNISGITYSHTHNVAQVVAHTHSMKVAMAYPNYGTVNASACGGYTGFAVIGSYDTGAGGTSGAKTLAGSGTVSGDGGWRPASLKCILARKD